jgi:hypothetical protein
MTAKRSSVEKSAPLHGEEPPTPDLVELTQRAYQGVQIDSPLGLILEMRGGKGYRARGYLGHDSALKALGLEQ